jgi:GrpB-like predicted nucleotidyltransferase (UPF0157 family)
VQQPQHRHLEAVALAHAADDGLDLLPPRHPHLERRQRAEHRLVPEAQHDRHHARAHRRESPGDGHTRAMARRTREQELAEVIVGSLDRLDGPVVLADPNPRWPQLFQREATRIRRALGPCALRIEHVGSTSIPNLVAKPIIDIALVVEDSADEPAYLPALEAAGYRLRIRSPDWEEHRMFKGPDTDINLHVFSPGSTEVQRMVRLRDHLRAQAADRARYAAEKQALARRRWAFMQDYADAKGSVVEAILARARAG